MSDSPEIRIHHLSLSKEKEVKASGLHFVFLLKDVVVLQSSQGYSFAVDGTTVHLPAIIYHLGSGLSVVEPLIYKNDNLEVIFKRRAQQWKEARS